MPVRRELVLGVEVSISDAKLHALHEVIRVTPGPLSSPRRERAVVVGRVLVQRRVGRHRGFALHRRVTDRPERVEPALGIRTLTGRAPTVLAPFLLAPVPLQPEVTLVGREAVKLPQSQVKTLGDGQVTLDLWVEGENFPARGSAIP